LILIQDLASSKGIHGLFLDEISTNDDDNAV
jgi:hypothetical protein